MIQNSDKKYRIFIHTNGDTIIERKPNLIESIREEPIYSRLHFINKDEIKLVFLFKQVLNKNMWFFVSDKAQNMSYYLKREKQVEGK